jgi:hypothetical protein
MPAKPTIPKRLDASARATRLFWIICLLGWTALLVITASSIHVAGFRPFGLVVQMTLALWLPYGLLTPLVFLTVRRYPITFATWRSTIGIHLLASLVFVIVCQGVFLGVMKAIEPAMEKSFKEQQVQAPPVVDLMQRGRHPPFFEVSPETGLPKPNFHMLIFKAVTNLPLYWVLAAFAHALLAPARLREREQQAAELSAHLSQAHLAGLRTQLQPHFLFNTLNSISALIPQNAALANEMVLNLSDLLRMTLRDPQRGEIPLSEELQLLGHYVDIQKLRFGERLRFKLEADEAALNFPVPPLLLQPLVENAIRYGVEPSEQPEQIIVHARLAEQTLALEVANTCQVSGEDIAAGDHSTGVGLANTRARLAALYGAGQTFQFGPLPDGGFRVWMTIPLRRPTTDTP